MIVRALTVLCLAAGLCRFTVRDVGFVDLGDPGYRYYTFVSEAESPGVTEACRNVAEAVFAETNIEFEIVDPDDDVGQPAHRYLRELQIQELPTTVLVHPDGQALEVPFGGKFDDVGARIFESVASSKLRERVTDAVLRHYCVVLLVECEDATQNAAARKAIQTSFSAIEKVFDRMPKDVGKLPELIAVARSEQDDEKILLWSLGIEVHGPHPAVAVLTGRGRRFGSTLVGEDIDEDSVLGILAKAGESCECGLDRSWMRGLRLPLRWDAGTRQLAVDLLGFDPENPLVKSEISSILAKGPNGKTAKKTGEPSVEDLLLGYTEEGVEDLLDGDLAEDQPGAPEDSEDGASGLALWITLGGLLVVSLGIAVFVLKRNGV